jgi:DNA (cytosine-5)-methyltransferase 1
VANTDSGDKHGRSGNVQMGRQSVSSEIAPDGYARGTEWIVEPDVGRVANGIPNRVDRLRALGNAIVPQVAEVIGRAIMASAS